MSSEFSIITPPFNYKLTASVGFVQVSGAPGRYVIVKNKRGWDIPGGHIEKGEDALSAFERELFEESSCRLLSGARMFAVLQSKKNPKTGIAVYSALCLPKTFKSTPEIEERQFVSLDELVDSYFGDKELIQELYELM